MGSRNSPNDLRAAIKALTRVKGFNEPFEQGGRVIWHKGNGDADLVSWVDGKGRLLKQMLVLFDDVIVWQHGLVMRSGSLAPRGDASIPRLENVSLDSSLEKDRHGRAKLAAEPYEGDDKYIMHFARAVSAPAGLTGAAVVTRPSNDVLQRQVRALRQREASKRNTRIALIVGVGLVVLLLAVVMLRRH
jgi:hypothetical protein